MMADIQLAYTVQDSYKTFVYDKHNRAITCMFCLDLIKNLTLLCFAVSFPGHFNYLSEQRRLGTNNNFS